MKSLMSYLVGALVWALASLSAWAGGSSGSGNILVAPQLAVAGDGPVTATFLGASQPISQSFVTVWALTAPANAFSLGFGLAPTPGAQGQTPFLPGGTDITLGAVFPIPETSGDHVLSRTALAPGINVNAPRIEGSLAVETFSANAGVIETGPNRVLIGFNPFLAPQPASFDGFPIRIAVSNVCVR